MPHSGLPTTLGALRASVFYYQLHSGRSLKEELRTNLYANWPVVRRCFRLIGYEETVIPQMVNAILSRHNFILLGLRGQAKTRLARMLTQPARSSDATRGWLRDP